MDRLVLRPSRAYQVTPRQGASRRALGCPRGLAAGSVVAWVRLSLFSAICDNMLATAARGRGWALLSRRWTSSLAAVPVHAASPPQPIRALLAAHQQRAQQDDVEPSPVQIVGHARSIRTHRNLTFLSLTDGSLPGDATLQAVLRGPVKAQWDSLLSLGTALELTGRLQASKGASQAVEFAVEQLAVTGSSEASTYPLAGPASTSTHPAVLLRKHAHLRPRDARHAAVLRTRNAMEKGLSDYFWDHDFTRVAAPILTNADCEGGGEVFSVDVAGKEGEVATAAANGIPHADVTDKGQSFWSDSSAYLTVSSQLHLEALVLGLGRVYTVGPSFRAESSATNRHLAEFWMCEGELLTSSDESVALDQVMAVVEGLIKRIIEVSLGNGEAEYLWANDGEGLELLKQQAMRGWRRMTYTQAVEALQQQEREQEHSFSIAAPTWGESLASEHERWLARETPVFVTHYPAAIKPFYMRMGGDGLTVACFDLLVPRIGELVGGSLREERQDVLANRVASLPLAPNLQWYVEDLRKYGCNPHGGFGLGMERLLSYISRTDNLRDCLTFPRVKGPLRF